MWGSMLLLSVYMQNIISASWDKVGIIALLLDCVVLLCMVIVKPKVRLYSLLSYFGSMYFWTPPVEVKEIKENCSFWFFSVAGVILLIILVIL